MKQQLKKMHILKLFLRSQLSPTFLLNSLIKGEYDIWAMKMQNFILSSDLLCWNIVLKGNSAKSMTIDNDGNLKIRPPVTAEEHQQARFSGNAESKKMQKSLLKQKFKEFKISEEEGLDKDYDKMQKILTQMSILKIKHEPKDVNMKFLRGLPPSWSGIALILKTKGGLEYISFDDLYNKLKCLDIDTKGYSSSSSTLSNAAFISTAGSSQGNLSYQESGNGGYTTTLSVSLGSSSSKGSLKSKCSDVDDVIYSFFANHEIDQHLVYEDLDQMNKEDFEEENARFDNKLVKCFNCKQMGHFSRECRAQSGQNSNNYQKYKSKEAGKDRSDSKVMVVVDGSIDWDKQTEAGNTEPRSLENFGMIAGIKIESDVDSEGEVVSVDDAIPASVFVSAGNVAAAVVSPYVSAPASESKDTIVIDCDRQEDFPSVCSIETDVKSSKTLCNKFGSFNKASHFRKHKYVASKSCYVCGSYLHLIKDCDLHEQRFAKRNAKGKQNPVSAGQQNPVSAGQQNPISDGQPNLVSASQPNPVSAGQQNPISDGQPNLVSASQPNPDNSLRLEKAKDRGIVDSGCSRSMSGNKDKLEDFEDFDGGEVTFAGSTGKISGKGTIKTKNLNFENTHRVLFTKNECLVLSKDLPLPDPSLVILSIPRKHNLYTFSLNELTPKGLLTCLIAKASQNESTLWHRRLGHVNFKNMNKLVKGNLVRGLRGFDGTISMPKLHNKMELLKRKNRTHIEAARTMLADSLLPTIFWTEAVATACYVLNRVLVTNPHNKTPYELLTGDKPSISYLKPFDHLKYKKIKETMNLIFLENKPFVAGTGQALMFNIDYLTDSLNSSRVSSTNLTAGSQGATPSSAGSQEADSNSDDVPIVDEVTTQNDGTKSDHATTHADNLDELTELQALQSSTVSAGSTPPVFAGSTPPMSLCASPIYADRHLISAGKSHVSAGRPTGSAGRPVSAGRPSGSADRIPVPANINDGLKIFDCPKSSIFTSSSYDEEFSGPDANNLESSLDVHSIITERIHNIHPTSQVLGDINSPVQTRSQVKHKGSSESAFISYIHDQRRNNHTDFQLSRIKAIRLFLAFASFMGFMMYQMDVKSAFLYGKIAEEVYVTQPRGFEDPDYPKKVYKVVKALYGLHQAPKAWYERLSTFLLKHDIC
nr:ribonuclease H-like domain-containing protein [Tanacetum cinerariifolium]